MATPTAAAARTTPASGPAITWCTSDSMSMVGVQPGDLVPGQLPRGVGGRDDPVVGADDHIAHAVSLSRGRNPPKTLPRERPPRNIAGRRLMFGPSEARRARSV